MELKVIAKWAKQASVWAKVRCLTLEPDRHITLKLFRTVVSVANFDLLIFFKTTEKLKKQNFWI